MAKPTEDVLILQKRIKEQRDTIKSLMNKHEVGNKKARAKNEGLQMALGKRALIIDRQSEQIRHLSARNEKLEAAHSAHVRKIWCPICDHSHA